MAAVEDLDLNNCCTLTELIFSARRLLLDSAFTNSSEKVISETLVAFVKPQHTPGCLVKCQCFSFVSRFHWKLIKTCRGPNTKHIQHSFITTKHSLTLLEISTGNMHQTYNIKMSGKSGSTLQASQKHSTKLKLALCKAHSVNTRLEQWDRWNTYPGRSCYNSFVMWLQ